MSMTKAAPGDDPPSDEKTDELGPAQREAIRKFMLGLAIPAGVILSVVSFVLGFGINEVARGSAYTKAFGDAQSLIIAAAQASGAAQGKSEEAARQIVKLRVDIEDANRIGRGSESVLFGLHKACGNDRPLRVGFRREGILCGRRRASPGQACWG